MLTDDQSIGQPSFHTRSDRKNISKRWRSADPRLQVEDLLSKHSVARALGQMQRASEKVKERHQNNYVWVEEAKIKNNQLYKCGLQKIVLECFNFWNDFLRQLWKKLRLANCLVVSILAAQIIYEGCDMNKSGGEGHYTQ